MLKTLLRTVVPFYQESLDSKLIWAAKQGDVNQVESLLEQGANVNATDGEGNTPLYLAVCINSLPVARCLINRGANVNSINNELGNTPLHQATGQESLEMAQLLVEKGANSCQTNDEGYTPVHYAACYGGADVLRLLAAPNNINIQTTNGITPFSLALEMGCLENAKVLVDIKDIDLNLPDKNGKTPLMIALDESWIHMINQDNDAFEAYKPT